MVAGPGAAMALGRQMEYIENVTSSSLSSERKRFKNSALPRAATKPSLA
jgi:hypothetical protein